MGGGDGWEGESRVGVSGKNISSVLPPEGLRYEEAVGRREQVHGNTEIIAYACFSYCIASCGLRKNSAQPGQEAVGGVGVKSDCDLFHPSLGFANPVYLAFKLNEGFPETDIKVQATLVLLSRP